MILVDLQAPVFDRIYDFELDEQLKAEELLKDILILIGEEETCRQSKEVGMALYAARQERILDPHRTLQQQGVRWGQVDFNLGGNHGVEDTVKDKGAESVDVGSRAEPYRGEGSFGYTGNAGGTAWKRMEKQRYGVVGK